MAIWGEPSDPFTLHEETAFLEKGALVPANGGQIKQRGERSTDGRRLGYAADVPESYQVSIMVLSARSWVIPQPCS